MVTSNGPKWMGCCGGSSETGSELLILLLLVAVVAMSLEGAAALVKNGREMMARVSLSQILMSMLQDVSGCGGVVVVVVVVVGVSERYWWMSWR